MTQPRAATPAVVELQKGRAELPVYFMYASPTSSGSPVMGEGIRIRDGGAVARCRGVTRWLPTGVRLSDSGAARCAVRRGPERSHTLFLLCAGGTLLWRNHSFEAAHQIRKQGGQVELSSS